jgi:transposase
MVALVRQGMAMRAVARQFHVSLPTVQRWVKRAQRRRLDRVDWREHSSRPHHTRRIAESLEELVLHVRQELKDQSDLGEFGAVAIFRELTTRGLVSLRSPPCGPLAGFWPGAGCSTPADVSAVVPRRWAGICP